MVSREEVEKRIGNFINKVSRKQKRKKFVCSCCGNVTKNSLKHPKKFLCKECVNKGAIQIMKLKEGKKITNDDLMDYQRW